MEQEYLDIVDEKNNPTGQKVLRAEAHQKGLWHRTIHLYVLRRRNGRTEFLIHLRSANKDRNPNKWAISFGGHIAAGGTVEDTLVREAMEEIGLPIRLQDVVSAPVRTHDDFPNREFIYPFFIEIEGDQKFIFHDGEVQKAEWMPLEEIRKSMETKDRVWASSLRGLLERMKQIEQLFPENQ